MDLEECNQITDQTLINLAIGCPSLEKLVGVNRNARQQLVNCTNRSLQTLSHCELITDDGIRQLAAGSCAAESLSVLELDNCPLITDQTLEHLVSCHNLQRIELYDCQMITRAAIRRLRVSIILGVFDCHRTYRENDSYFSIWIQFLIVNSVKNCREITKNHFNRLASPFEYSAQFKRTDDCFNYVIKISVSKPHRSEITSFLAKTSPILVLFLCIVKFSRREIQVALN